MSQKSHQNMNKGENINNKNVKDEWRTRDRSNIKIRYLPVCCDGHWWLLGNSVQAGALNWRNGETRWWQNQSRCYAICLTSGAKVKDQVWHMTYLGQFKTVLWLYACWYKNSQGVLFLKSSTFIQQT